MKITILGNGGAINDGLPYNAFISGESFLCEAPPDIMESLNRQDFESERIHTIFISHLHADHCFGLPFLLLDIFFKMAITKTVPLEPIRIFGPHGTAKTAEDLVSIGLGKEHPVMEWMKKNVQFITIDGNTEHCLTGDTVSRFYRMKHPFETWGFTIARGNEVCFAYIADTLWNENIEAVLKLNPRNVLIDLNGEPGDPIPVHLSEKELLGKIKELKTGKTRFWGTHLKRDKKSPGGTLRYVKPGMVIQTD